MIEAALLILAQRPFLEQRIGTLFCGRRGDALREQCLKTVQSRQCGFG
ncbi:MAG TPA: hypothetical protein VH331_16395 [Allosphingosinicella sp.]|nr:hypothetical protein [Allosphingosinicella sp.]